MSQNKSVDLSVIIVNYNVQYFLEQALLSVQAASQNLDMEVFVVDNNSVDDSVEMVRQKFPEVKLIANKHNPGFSIANNQAIEQSAGKYVLLLNPDTVVEEDTFDTCVAFMDAHPDAGALGVKMIDGSGKFLPESKRGFPSPFVAFSKTFGLSKLFPKSRTFNHYHLGYLDKDENHEVEVLAGAFMLMRKSVLDEIGLLDETFFMYGEDIDLSYRVIKAGYKNYYLADTTIIHYKGESTKKGSLNYVRTFYNAMIIFAKKHFTGRQASLFILMLKGAIYFRATLTLLTNWAKRLFLPFLDATLLFSGLIFLKDFWENYHFKTDSYYRDELLYLNFPLYTLIWIATIYFSGNYDENGNLRRLIRGILVGSLFIAAVYGFLPLDYRYSRALIVLGTAWALLSTTSLRVLMHFIKHRDFNVGKVQVRNLVIVGSKEESKRVQELLHQADVDKNFIGTVATSENEDRSIYLSNIEQLDEVVQIYKIEEIIFCSKDVSAQETMRWMTTLGPDIHYKIVPKESLSIIGSSYKNTSGELYTIDIQYNIAAPLQKRNKRLFDVLLSLFLLISLPIHLLFVQNRLGLVRNIFQTIFGQKTWVAYIQPISNTLPVLRESVLSVADGIHIKNLSQATKERLNFLYAKDYSVSRDLEVCWRGYRNLGRG